MDIAFLVIIGIIGGIVAGLLGLGGGIFYVLIFPYLIEARGLPPEINAQLVIANSLFGVMVASGRSVLGYHQKGLFPIKEIIAIGTASAIVGYLSIHFIVLQAWFSKTIFNIFIIILMLYILLKMYLELKIEKKEDGHISIYQGITSGGIAGFVSALSGLGGGIIIIPILSMRFKFSLLKAKSISLAMIFISSLTISINNLFTQPPQTITSVKTIGYIIPSLIIPVTIGVLIGSPLGVKWSTKLARRALDLLFMAFVLIVLAEKSYDLLRIIL
ncbi:MAG: sulfite exporter TauE/SafE family protein [Bacteroidales bacterium]|nr:sulfite exporter TauE/SafE family protein [Bacteroidales bacterium]